MKRILMLLIVTAAALSQAAAQKGLNINALFDGRYRDCPQATETVIKGSQLSGYGLDLYHSLTLVDLPDEAASVEALVSRDGAKAVDREVSYRDGGLYYGFYQLPGSIPKRYLFFLNQHRGKGNKIIVIYLEGSASRDKIKKMLKQ